MQFHWPGHAARAWPGELASICEQGAGCALIQGWHILWSPQAPFLLRQQLAAELLGSCVARHSTHGVHSGALEQLNAHLESITFISQTSIVA